MLEAHNPRDRCREGKNQQSTQDFQWTLEQRFSRTPPRAKPLYQLSGH